MSSAEFPGLTLLRCRNCVSDLDGLSADVIFYCGNCGRCWVYGEDFEEVSIQFVRPDEGTILLPFWKVDADVVVRRRITRRESSASIAEGFRDFTGREMGLSNGEPESRRDRFIFPAFSTSRVLSTGVRMHAENFLPETGVPAGRLTVTGGSTGFDDARVFAKGVAVGVEVNRRDFLAYVDLDITVSSIGIYAIGCVPGKHMFRLSGSRIGIPYATVRDSEEILRRSGFRNGPVSS